MKEQRYHGHHRREGERKEGQKRRGEERWKERGNMLGSDREMTSL